MQKNDGGLPITVHRMLPFSALIGKHLSSAPAPGFEWLSCIPTKGRENCHHDFKNMPWHKKKGNILST